MFSVEIKPSEKTLRFDKFKITRAVRAAGQEVASIAKSLIQSSRGSGRNGASRPGQPPASQSGNLARSIKAQMLSTTKVSIRDSVAYAVALEAGAHGPGKRVMAPRPYLSAALEQDKNAVADRIHSASMESISFS